MEWKTRSLADNGSARNVACHVCGSPIVESATPDVAYFPDLEHGGTPGSLEYLEERHGIDLGDELTVVCTACREKIDGLLR